MAGSRRFLAKGQLAGENDFEAQAEQVFQNLQAVLEEAGASFADVVKLTVFLTDIGRLLDYTQIKGRFIEGPQPASTALEVTALARPEMMIEVEAVAAL
ncbi:MAG: RidA family protein [Solirubrobacterales bacterium]